MQSLGFSRYSFVKNLKIGFQMCKLPHKYKRFDISFEIGLEFEAGLGSVDSFQREGFDVKLISFERCQASTAWQISANLDYFVEFT